MTLFSLTQNKEKVFNQVLTKYFDGEMCYKTVKLLKGKL